MAKKDKLNIVQLDFDSIKNNLKEFMRDQDEFTDYDFEGSGLSVLLDVLAYNTHYMAYYMNMLANEMFMDSAVTRKSIVSHAKLLGYTPRSRVASQATINVSFQEVVGGSNSAMVLPRFTKFATNSKDGVNYIFVTTEQRVVNKNESGFFNFSNLRISEGYPNSFTFTHDEVTNPKQSFVIPDVGIDISTLKVQVQKSAQNIERETYTLADNAVSVTGDSKVFYLEENRNNLFQIYFGDDIIGKKLENGNIVIVSYIITSGAPANGIKVFKLVDGAVKPGSTPTITLVTESSSGKGEESVDSIKFNATKAFIAQNRAITKNDYIALINRRYPYFDSVNVWGGEENDPPIYGKVFFSVKPRGNYEVTTTEIEYIKNEVIKPVSILTVTSDYVAPDYNYINVISDVTYDPRKTTKSLGEIQTIVYNSIVGYAANNLNTFNSTLKYSKLIKEIDDSDASIENSSIKIIFEKRFKPALGQTKNYRLNFYSPIKRGTSADRVYSEPAFEHYDNSQILRTCFIEETPQAFSGVEEIEVINSGTGYVSLPEVIIDGDGKGARAEAVIINGKINSIRILSNGSNYSSAIARIEGGGGSGATIKPILQAKKGTLRLFYYDSNNLKKIINEDIGTIYYQDGYIEINNFTPETISDPFGTLVFKAQPDTFKYASSKNSILTLDVTDPGSIKVNINLVTT